ncbi:MAG: hypothetical protein ACOYL5_03175 [Phototrophicaceae bacterium]|jgi:hypothetical protein
MPYSIEFISLQCLKNQELDGDEIYLKFNDQVVFHWEDTGYHWAAELLIDDLTDYYDFRANLLRTKQGNIAVGAYADYGFLFSGLEGESRVELWESDEGNVFRGGDDDLGTLRITEANISNEAQQAQFTLQNTHYVLTFGVYGE